MSTYMVAHNHTRKESVFGMWLNNDYFKIMSVEDAEWDRKAEAYQDLLDEEFWNGGDAIDWTDEYSDLMSRPQGYKDVTEEFEQWADEVAQTIKEVK